MKYAFLFPGQGAQYPGMAKDFYDQYLPSREIFEQADDMLHFSLSQCIFEGSKEMLMQTRYSQLAIYVASLAILKALHHEFPDLHPRICAGLSLGEYTALTASGKITFEDGLPLVQSRGLFMQEASEENPGTLAAVLGMPVEEIAKQEGIWIANLNCPGQVVIAGTLDAIDRATKMLKENGAKRVIPLDVSGAFHSGLMKSAQIKLEKFIRVIPIRETQIELVMNVSGDFVRDVSAIRENLIDQVVSTTKWEKGIRMMDGYGIETYVEIGPGKTLSGMNRKMGLKGSTINIESIKDLEVFHAAVKG